VGAEKFSKIHITLHFYACKSAVESPWVSPRPPVSLTITRKMKAV